ncbi:MAG: TerC family protein, partial [Methylobacterium sp.]|nr:TerC family protein [Methylobacterium sp.]
RFPVIVWGGAALLGWIAGEMLVTDPIVMDWIKALNPAYLTNVQESDGHGGMVSKIMPIAVIFYGAAVVGAAAVLGIGHMVKGRKTEAA